MASLLAALLWRYQKLTFILFWTEPWKLWTVATCFWLVARCYIMFFFSCTKNIFSWVLGSGLCHHLQLGDIQESYSLMERDTCGRNKQSDTERQLGYCVTQKAWDRCSVWTVIVLSSGLVLLLVRSTEERIMGRTTWHHFPSHGTFVKRLEFTCCVWRSELPHSHLD
jgi:hypothetical protein